MNHRRISLILSIPLITLFLAGCISGPNMAFTPEQVAIRGVIDQHGSGAVVDQSSVQIRQSLPMDRNTFVVVSFTQMEGDRKDKCLFVYHLIRNIIGAWQPRSGGGGCSGTFIGGPEQPGQSVEIGGGQSGSTGPGDPGYSHTAGLVNQKDITKVRVTWNDGSQQEVDVINSSYIAVRTGSLINQKVEGLNADGEVVFKNERQVAPGKE